MGDVLDLHDDGTVTLGWGDFKATLREPTVGEWLSFEQEAGRANAWARNEDGDEVEQDRPKRTLLEAADGGPFLALYGRMIRELAIGDMGDVPELPPWLAVGSVYSHISSWWSASPLSRRAAAGPLTTTSSR